MARRSDPAHTRALLVAGAVALLAPTVAPPAHAWTPRTQAHIAESALAIAPADLRRQIEKHMARFRDGSAAPFRSGEGSHYKNGNGGGRLDEAILAETERAIQFIRSHRPFRDIAFQLGVLSHYVADANNPLSTDEGDPRERLYFTDFQSYVEATQSRFALVFYGDGRDLSGTAAVGDLVERTLSRGRHLYPSVGREYRRVGGPPGRRKFDDKSVAFAVGSLALSHAVSDVGAVFRYVWIEAGGADNRELPVTLPKQPPN